jgi:hypothetical protein
LLECRQERDAARGLTDAIGKALAEMAGQRDAARAAMDAAERRELKALRERDIALANWRRAKDVAEVELARAEAAEHAWYAACQRADSSDALGWSRALAAAAKWVDDKWFHVIDDTVRGKITAEILALKDTDDAK